MPFCIAWDKREKLPYGFQLIRAESRHVAALFRRKLPAGRTANCRAIAAKWHEEHPEYKNAVLDIQTQKTWLTSGDYSITGMEHLIAIERKSKEDLYSTLGQHRERFERELQRLAEMPRAHVVIEAEWLSIVKQPPTRSRLHPQTIVGSVLAWTNRYPSIHWWPMPSRRAAEITVFKILERFWLDMRDRKVAALT